MRIWRSSQLTDFAGWEFPKFFQWDIALFSKFWWQKSGSWTEKSIWSIISMLLIFLELDLAVSDKNFKIKAWTKQKLIFFLYQISQKSKAAGVMLHDVKNQASFTFILLSSYSEKHSPHSYIYLIIQHGCSDSSQHFCLPTCKKETIEGERHASCRYTSPMLHRPLFLAFLWSDMRPAVRLASGKAGKCGFLFWKVLGLAS